MIMNHEQDEAVRYLDGSLLVLAGAGSGKTRVITHKIAYLVEQADFEARHIAAITFTNKAAKEMQERTRKLVDTSRLKGLMISTFHALGLYILRQECRVLGYKPRFSVLDYHDTHKLLHDIWGMADKDEIRRLQSQISFWKNKGLQAYQVDTDQQDPWYQQAMKTFAVYERTLLTYQAVDFDDLLVLPHRLFAEYPERLAHWQGRLRYLLIDEYQDTNEIQYRLIQQWVGVRGMFTAVGDDDQSIYAWRGADSANIEKLQRDFPRLKVLKLEQNYRSTGYILQAANNMITHNTKLFEKKLWSKLGEGHKIQIVPCKDEEHEAEQVVMRLLAHQIQHRVPMGHYAILYRSNHQSRAIETALRQQHVPYLVSGGQSFFEKSEIKDIAAYLRLLLNEDDDPAFIRALTTPKRGFGPQSLEKLGSYAAKRHKSLFAAAYEEGALQQLKTEQADILQAFCQWISTLQIRAERESPAGLLQEIVTSVAYETWLYDQHDNTKVAEQRWSNVLELLSWVERQAEKKDKNLLELTQTMVLINLLEGRKKERAEDFVQLSTLHAAKGLEYPHVFLIGCEEGILPHHESSAAEKIEEERRLMYVGITRAQETFTVSFCKKRKKSGDWVSTESSRFLKEMGEIPTLWLGQGGSEQSAHGYQTGLDHLAGLKAMLQP